MSPLDDVHPAVQDALNVVDQAQQQTRTALSTTGEPSVGAVMTRGTPIPPHAPDPTPAARDAARADARAGAIYVNQRLDTIVPPRERVAGGVYQAGAPGGGRWVDLPRHVLARAGLGFRKRQQETTGNGSEGPVLPGLGGAQTAATPAEPSDDDHLRRMWDEAVSESSAAAKHAVNTHNVKPTFTADDWHQALSLPFLDHLWYELSGEKLAEHIPGLTHSEHMKMLDVLGATSARAKPDENLERTLAVMSQHLRGVPIDVDLTIPSTVKQALARNHKQGTSALPGNKTGHFSDTLALAGGVPARYPISVNDVWVGRMFGVPDEVMSGNQSLHEPMAKYFNKIRDFYNDRFKDELPFPYQSWNFQAGAWVHLRSKDAGRKEGDAYHQVWDKTVQKLQNAGVKGIVDGKITRDALMDPKFADALRPTVKPWRDAPKATVELGTKLTNVGQQAHDLYHDAIARGDELSQKEYLSGITTAMYASARGKGHPWERLKKAITGDVTSRGDITRIGHPITESPFETGGTFEGAVSPNIRIPLKDMDADHQAQFNAVAGKHLKQAAMAVSTILGAEQESEPRPGHTRGHSVFVPTQEQISADHLRSFAGALKAKGHETSFQRHPNGYQFDIMPAFGPEGPKGIDETTLDAAYGATLRPHYGMGEITPHDHTSVYTEAGDYGTHRRALTARIRDDYLRQAAAAGVGPKAAAAALRAETSPQDFPGGGKKAWDVYRARHDHLASAEAGFKDLAKRVNDSHAEFITRVQGRRAREAAAAARVKKADGGSVTDDEDPAAKAAGGALDMGSTPYSTSVVSPGTSGAPDASGGTAQRGANVAGLAMSGAGSGAGSGTDGSPGNAKEFLQQLSSDPKAEGMARFVASGMLSSGNYTSQGQDMTKPDQAITKADGGLVTDDVDPAPPPAQDLTQPIQPAQQVTPATPSYIKPVDEDKRRLSPIGLYSHAADVVWKSSQMKGSPTQFKAMLTKAGVKPDEFKWSGYDDAFAGKPVVTKREVRDHFVRNLPKIQESVHTTQTDKYGGEYSRHPDDDSWQETKYSDYQLPGGKNYREVVLHLPDERSKHAQQVHEITERIADLEDERDNASGEDRARIQANIERFQEQRETLGGGKLAAGYGAQYYKSTHWDEPNVLAHLRMSDREGPVKLKYSWRNRISGNTTRTFDSADEAQQHLETLPEKLRGNLAMVTKPVAQKILHLEELQSDWGQEAREKGLKTTLTPEEITERESLGRSTDPRGLSPEQVVRLRELNDKTQKGAPPAPYIDSTAKWTDLGLKRALHEAAKGGYDKLVVTPGEEQAKRYDLSQHIRQVMAKHNPETGKYGITAYPHGSDNAAHADDHTAEELPNVIGKELAERVVKETSAAPNRTHVYNGLDLKVGGEGMKGYYDTIVPKALEKLARQHDPEARVRPHAHTIDNRDELLRATHDNYQAFKNWVRNNPKYADIGDEGHIHNAFRRDQKGAMVRDYLAAHPAIKLHAIDITPKMRASILAGQKGYASGGRISERLHDDLYQKLRKSVDITGRYP